MFWHQEHEDNERRIHRTIYVLRHFCLVEKKQAVVLHYGKSKK